MDRGAVETVGTEQPLWASTRVPTTDWGAHRPQCADAVKTSTSVRDITALAAERRFSHTPPEQVDASSADGVRYNVPRARSNPAAAMR